MKSLRTEIVSPRPALLGCENKWLACRCCWPFCAALPLERLSRTGLTKGVAALERIGSDPARWRPIDFKTVAQWTMKSDPKTYVQTMKLLKNAVWYSPGYSLRDIWNFVAAMEFSLEQLLPEVPCCDAWRMGTRFELPFFLFQGENDVLTPTALAEQYFADVIAPIKRMILIRGAGHFAAFIQPRQFLDQLLVQVLPLTTHEACN